MKKTKVMSLVTVITVLSLFLSGCVPFGPNIFDIMDIADQIIDFLPESASAPDLKYTRPDMDKFQEKLSVCCRLAAESKNFRKVENGILDFYDAYDEFYTMLNLADIRYCADLKDTYWKEEYDFCMSQSGTVDFGLESLYYALADSPLREKLEGEDYFGAGFFDDYQGESVWDETLTDLVDREAELVGEYYEIFGETPDTQIGSAEFYDTAGHRLAELYVKLISVRQEIADCYDYDSYVSYADETAYSRDFTPEQIEKYLGDIRKKLVPLYRELDMEDWELNYYDEDDTFSYVKDMAEDMGGEIEEIFEKLEDGEFYDISFGKNKMDTSFEVYLSSYGVPYIFMAPSATDYDPLTFAHEFGHFCNDYSCGGSVAGADVAEIFSQALEYLSLCYGEKTESIRKLKLGDCLCTYVEQAAYHDFERRAYGLRGDKLTAENIEELYLSVMDEYGVEVLDESGRDFVTISHFYTNPMYIISYVISNDAAFRIYQMEMEKPGSGLKTYTEHLSSEEPCFLAFLEEADLESPFAPERLDSVAELLRQELGL